MYWSFPSAPPFLPCPSPVAEAKRKLESTHELLNHTWRPSLFYSSTCFREVRCALVILCHVFAGSHIKSGRYTDAANMLMRFALACDAAHAASSQCKAYLGAVVVNLYSGNATEAWASYQVCLLTMPVSTHRLLFILCKAPFRLFLVLPGKFDYVALKHTIAARRVYCIHLLSNLHCMAWHRAACDCTWRLL